MDESYLSVRSAVESEIKVEGSRFIADLYPVCGEEEVQSYLNTIRKKYFDATHHCYAYVIGAGRSLVRHSDDGEPSGTAGVKILSAIQSKNLSDVLIIVTRYFGGTKLGIGGLGRAYYESAREAIDAAEIVTKMLMHVVEIQFAFDQTNAVLHAMHTSGIKIVHTEYTNEGSTVRVLVPPSKYEHCSSLLTNATRGQVHCSIVDQTIVVL